MNYAFMILGIQYFRNSNKIKSDNSAIYLRSLLKISILRRQNKTRLHLHKIFHFLWNRLLARKIVQKGEIQFFKYCNKHWWESIWMIEIWFYATMPFRPLTLSFVSNEKKISIKVGKKLVYNVVWFPAVFFYG
jgi:hypothetical protein